MSHWHLAPWCVFILKCVHTLNNKTNASSGEKLEISEKPGKFCWMGSCPNCAGILQIFLFYYLSIKKFKSRRLFFSPAETCAGNPSYLGG
jgi:hypothetical protein